MKPFPEKPIDRVASTSICVRTELEANGGVSGGASHKAICHGRETAQMGMQCFNLGARASLHRG